MLALPLDLANVLYMLSYLSPLYLIFFMLMSSLFNQDVKALVWLGGVALFTIVVIGLQRLFKSGVQLDRSPVCSMFSIGGLTIPSYDSPSVPSFFIIFTLVYLVLPMFTNKMWNYYIIIGFAGLFVIDTLTKLRGKCTTPSGVLFGGFFGALFAIVWYQIIQGAGGAKLLYFNTAGSNNVVCSKPKQQTFKCLVYKNGQLIGENIA